MKSTRSHEQYNLIIFNYASNAICIQIYFAVEQIDTHFSLFDKLCLFIEISDLQTLQSTSTIIKIRLIAQDY